MSDIEREPFSQRKITELLLGKINAPKNQAQVTGMPGTPKLLQYLRRRAGQPLQSGETEIPKPKVKTEYPFLE